MILIFGGTTEGRIAADTLDDAGKPFYYSTKSGRQEVAMRHGIQILLNGRNELYARHILILLLKVHYTLDNDNYIQAPFLHR